MSNKRLGKIGSVILAAAVLLFAISMVFGLTGYSNSIFFSCLFSMFIAIGFIIFIVSLYSCNKDEERRGVALTAVAFAIVYASLIFIVYYAECTTVNLNKTLSDEALSIINFGKTGSLFFNYDLLGYGFMSLSTFLIGFAIKVRNKNDKAFKYMLWIHGVFFIACFFMPMFPIFMEGSSYMAGTIALEIWCVYFFIVSALGYKYFDEN